MADEIRSADEPTESEAAGVTAHKLRGQRVMTVLIAIAVIMGVGVIVLYAYNKGRQEGESRVPPIIQPEEGPMKIRPKSPGGMKVPNQDKEVFRRFELEKGPDRIERLLPPPEKPIKMIENSTNAGTPASPKVTLKAPEISPPLRSPLPKNDQKIQIKKPPLPPDIKQTNKKNAPLKEDNRTFVGDKERQTSGLYRVQISSLRSEVVLRRSWAALKLRHKDLFASQPLIVERAVLTGGRGTFYRMQIGPLKSMKQASTLCDKIKLKKLSCFVVRR